MKINIPVVLRIGSNDLRLFLKDRSGVLWAFVMPLIFTFVFGVAFKGLSVSAVKATITLDNRDDGFLSKALVSELGKENIRLVLADTLKENPVRTLVIPEGFTDSVLSRKRVALKLIREESASVSGTHTARVAIIRSLMKIISSQVILELEELERTCAAVDTDSAGGILFSAVLNGEMSGDELVQKFDSLLTREERISLKKGYAGRRAEIPAGFDNAVPGMLVMFVLMTMAFTGEGIIYERETGILRRYGYSVCTKSELVLGKLLGRFYFAAIQITFLLVAGRYLFGFRVGNELVAVVITLAIFAFSMGSYALLFGSLLKKVEQVSALTIVSTLALSALGGCWWPLEIVPRTFQIVGLALPTGWMMNALHKLISFGYGLDAVIPNLLALAGSGIVFLLISVRRLRFD